ncbi:MAG TPA: hypothetical protein PK536_04090 [Ignavibacteria bacterium]|nr:hypothetical protein [Ignavibacteria bacterium]
MKYALLCLMLFVVLTSLNYTFLKNPVSLNLSDTININNIREISLDTVKFLLFDDDASIENVRRDTIYINAGDSVYKIPYRISAKIVLDNAARNRYFKLTGLSLLDNAELESYLKDLFSNPRNKLKEEIPAKYWKRHEIYLRYFEPYDKNSPYLPGNSLNTDYDEDEVDDQITVLENYENFPLPETIDMEVDLRKIPRILKILDLEFDFDKLDKRFQRLILNSGKNEINQNRKSNLR